MKKVNINIDDELNYLINGSNVKSSQDFTDSVLNNLPSESRKKLKTGFNVSLLAIAIALNVFSIFYYVVENKSYSDNDANSEVRQKSIMTMVNTFDSDNK